MTWLLADGLRLDWLRRLVRLDSWLNWLLGQWVWNLFWFLLADWFLRFNRLRIESRINAVRIITTGSIRIWIILKRIWRKRLAREWLRE